jgi:hypothetical protein
VHAFRRRTSLLTEDGKVAGRLLALLDGIACGGKQIHDANVVATMLVHGIDTVVTLNLDYFIGFGQHVKLVGLALIRPDPMGSVAHSQRFDTVHDMILAGDLRR